MLESTQETSIQDALLEKLHMLPIDKQVEALDFVEFLCQKNQRQHSPRSIKGLCEDLNIHVSEEDIAEARQEMWDRFSRENI